MHADTADVSVASIAALAVVAAGYHRPQAQVNPRCSLVLGVWPLRPGAARVCKTMALYNCMCSVQAAALS